MGANPASASHGRGISGARRAEEQRVFRRPDANRHGGGRCAFPPYACYTTRFATDLLQPGLRIPVTMDADLFIEVVRLGREIIWLHTFGERFAAPGDGRPAGAPCLPQGTGPRIPAEGVIPSGADEMLDAISYDPGKRQLWIGAGHVDNVPPEVWAYQVSGKQVLTQWFSYRRRNRSRPIIGDRRPLSPLGDIQPKGWPAEYTTELLNTLHILGRLVALEPVQADLLMRICAGPKLMASALTVAITATQPLAAAERKSGKARDSRQRKLPA
jgi:hypothetical protein